MHTMYAQLVTIKRLIAPVNLVLEYGGGKVLFVFPFSQAYLPIELMSKEEGALWVFHIDCSKSPSEDNYDIADISAPG